ncbi:hypothetical protein Rs2_40454 [Raphanus sativus]|nr:hypothetical protein Rs2_40454 [Raphanus sativus]
MSRAFRDSLRRTKEDDILRESSFKRYGKTKHRTFPFPKSEEPGFMNQSSHQMISTALSAAREWQNSQITLPQKQRTVAIPPVSLDNVTVMRSDASWKENRNIAGLGWVIYGEDGPMKFSAVEEHVSTPLLAESIAMKESLAKCKEYTCQM